MLERDDTYRGLGIGCYDKRDRQAKERRLVRQPDALGNQVIIRPIPEAA